MNSCRRIPFLGKSQQSQPQVDSVHPYNNETELRKKKQNKTKEIS